MAYIALDPASERETNLGDLGGLARAGFTGDDHHLMLTDRLCDLRLLLADRQVVRIGDPGHTRQTGLVTRLGHRQIGCYGLQHGGLLAFRQLLDPVQTAGKTAGVKIHAGRETAAQRLDRERQGRNSLNKCPEGHIDKLGAILKSERGGASLKAAPAWFNGAAGNKKSRHPACSR